MSRFYVKAPSVNAVRRALGRAPGGARVVGRFDRETIECLHTMNEHSLGRHWAILVSRVEGAGLAVVERPGRAGEGISGIAGGGDSAQARAISGSGG